MSYDTGYTCHMTRIILTDIYRPGRKIAQPSKERRTTPPPTPQAPPPKATSDVRSAEREISCTSCAEWKKRALEAEKRLQDLKEKNLGSVKAYRLRKKYIPPTQS